MPGEKGLKGQPGNNGLIGKKACIVIFLHVQQHEIVLHSAYMTTIKCRGQSLYSVSVS